jgi:hypothetical protein
MAMLRARRGSADNAPNTDNHDTTHRGGRPMTDDAERLDRLAWHLAHDTDLHELGRTGKPILSEAARRAVRDLPAPHDIGPDGEVNPHAWRRLVRKFVWFCFDVPGRGFDEGEFKP